MVRLNPLKKSSTTKDFLWISIDSSSSVEVKKIEASLQGRKELMGHAPLKHKCFWQEGYAFGKRSLEVSGKS